MALGIVINTRTDLGVAAISSAPYAYSIIRNVSFGLTTFIMFIIFIFIQFAVLKKISCRIFMQIPMAILTSIFIEFFDKLLPFGKLPFAAAFILLIISNILTGLGVYLMTETKLILDPGNGIVETLCFYFKKPFSYLRVRFDILLVILTCLFGLTVRGKIVGIGLGTVVSAYLIGKSVGIFDNLLREKLRKLTTKSSS